MRKIYVVTSTRAEYGILSRLIKLLQTDTEIDFKLIATGTHFSRKFGETYQEILADNVIISHRVDIEIEKGPSHSMSIAIEKFSNLFQELKPDIVVLLGDRYEIMAVAIACMLNNIIIAHISGGEQTQGLTDEAIRHSITKMSHIHFASCETYRNRIIQLGEHPRRVFNVGALGAENIQKLSLLEKEDLEAQLGFRFLKKNLLITYHPVTLENNSAEQHFKAILDALDCLEHTKLIFTMPNAEKDCQIIMNLIDDYILKNQDKAISFISLGALRYFSMMRFVDAIIGNSSSGILEAPSFKVGTINIGDRQKGRIQTQSILNCKPEKYAILNAISVLYSEEFQSNLKCVKNIYYQENTAASILNILKNFDLTNILKREFYDLAITQ